MTVGRFTTSTGVTIVGAGDMTTTDAGAASTATTTITIGAAVVTVAKIVTVDAIATIMTAGAGMVIAVIEIGVPGSAIGAATTMTGATSARGVVSTTVPRAVN